VSDDRLQMALIREPVCIVRGLQPAIFGPNSRFVTRRRISSQKTQFRRLFVDVQQVHIAEINKKTIICTCETDTQVALLQLDIGALSIFVSLLRK